MRRIYYTGTDLGDGSTSVRFLDCQKCIDALEEHDPEMYRGEGGGSFMVSGEIAGITIYTYREILEEIENDKI